jgi:hypothetical protein
MKIEINYSLENELYREELRNKVKYFLDKFIEILNFPYKQTVTSSNPVYKSTTVGLFLFCFLDSYYAFQINHYFSLDYNLY